MRFPADHLFPWEGFESKPPVWCFKWPQYIIDRMITSKKLTSGGLLHLKALDQPFGIRERTTLSKTNNLDTLWWKQKGSATATNVLAQLLRLFDIQQQFHSYIPRHDFRSAPSNHIADALSREFDMPWNDLSGIPAMYLLPYPGPQHLKWSLLSQSPSSNIGRILGLYWLCHLPRHAHHSGGILVSP